MVSNRLLFFWVAMWLMPQVFVAQSEKIPAFPGAEGYGKYVTGGRGGRVIYVTKITNDDPTGASAGYPGSLRAALETSGSDPIVIMFKVGGVITLAGNIVCSRSNVTLAGQSAPGDGICVTNYGIKFTGKNIIVRHMRFRPGDQINQNDPALSFSNGSNAIFDHCSFSWSVEENVNVTDVDSVTVQYCINSESLYNSVHTKGARAYAAQWGGEHASYHHNLLAHHNTRMPRQNGNTSNDYQLTWDYRNNVHYNWGSNGAFYGGGIEQAGGFCHSNLINNYYKPGPATTATKSNQYFCAPSGGRPAVVGDGNDYLYGYGLWYLNGNVMFNNPDKTDNNWLGLSGSTNHYASGEFDAAPVTTQSAEEAYALVLAGAGATKPKRDAIDTRIVNEVTTGTATYGGDFGANKGIIDSDRNLMPTPSDVASSIITWIKTNYATVASTSTLVPTDTDADGIPNWWETANGLNPNDANDGKTLATNGGGYSNLEMYINSEDVGKTAPSGIKENTAPNFDVIRHGSEFELYSVMELSSVDVIDLKGSTMLSIPMNGWNRFELSNLPSGIYLIKVTFINGMSNVKKVVI